MTYMLLCLASSLLGYAMMLSSETKACRWICKERGNDDIYLLKIGEIITDTESNDNHGGIHGILFQIIQPAMFVVARAINLNNVQRQLCNDSSL